jgi:hypothetical protein
MYEAFVADAVKRQLESEGYIVATEVANFHRSADIAAISPENEVVIVECKISDMKRAVAQSRTHQLSADRVMMATPYRVLKAGTVDSIKRHGIGLYLVDISGSTTVAWPSDQTNAIWPMRREYLRRRILERSKK